MGFKDGRAWRWAGALAPITLLLTLATALWWPALFDGKTLVHGDAVYMGVVLTHYHAQALAGTGTLSWVSDVYGGHPLFAESQGGFCNPINIFVAAFVAPHLGVVAAANWLHWVFVALACGGFVGLARELGQSPAAQMLGGVAVVFSSGWFMIAPNLSIAAILATIPWALWAFEVWLKRPTLRVALLFGAACAWMVLAGYPVLAYGAVIYMGVSLLPGFLSAEVRTLWAKSWRSRVSTGIVAVAFCVGLAAVQLLPLIELAGLSYRTAGVNIPLTFNLAAQLRGAMFWQVYGAAQVPLVGSILICILASLAPVLNRSPRVLGIALATALLLNLGAGPASPLFSLAYTTGIVPGLQYFRIVFPFQLIGILGLGLLAGFAADALSRRMAASTVAASLLAAARKPWLWLSLLIVAGWVALAVHYHFDGAPTLTWWLALGSGVGAVALFAIRRPAWIAPLLAGTMLADAALLRLQPYQFFDAAIVSEPRDAALIKSRSNWRDYRHSHITRSEASAFMAPNNPSIGPEFERVRDALVAATNTLWGLSSIHGSFGLPLARRRMLDSVLENEWLGNDSTPPGLRLTDILAIRYLTFDRRVNASGYRVISRNRESNLWLMENTAAHSRFQFYSRYTTVPSPQAALPILSDLSAPLLVVEAPAGALPAPNAAMEEGGASYELIEDRADRYRLRIHASAPVWFFVADANYPGWRASIDGARAPLYSAQILGKAVLMPAGVHELRLEFRSDSIRWGVWISVASLLIAACALTWTSRTKRSASPQSR